MNRRQVSFLLAGVVVLSGVQGCSSPCGTRCAYLGPPRTVVAPPCANCTTTGPLPPPISTNPTPFVPAPSQSGGNIQQNSFVPSRPFNPSAPAVGAPGVALSAPEPVEPAARPMPRGDAPPQDSTRRYAPQTVEPPKAPTMPQAKDDGAASPALPVDIPGFATVKPNVANGQEPFAGGVLWLKAHGYNSILYLRAPGEDDSAVRRQFEDQKMQYLSLEVTPEKLSKEIVDKFNTLVDDPKNQPLFVYDRDSSLAGGLWYLHFRLIDKMTDEKARAEVVHLGFKEDRDGSHRNMWIAVQNYMGHLKP